MANDAPTNAPQKFGILLYPGFEPLDVFGPAEAFQMLSRTHAKLSLYLISNQPTLDAVSTAPPDPSFNPLGSSFFQSVVPTHTITTVPDDLEVLLVPGGLGTRAPPEELEATLKWMKDTYPKLHSFITVCTGGWLAARAGLFDGRRATTNKYSWSETANLGTNVNWDKGARWVKDGNVWSSGGVSAGTDVAFAFIADTWGESVARDTANRVEYEWHNDPNWDVFGYVW